MPHATKIATCNYCGTRAALVLTGAVRHELACSGCGAPLHDLKLMPAARGSERKTSKPARYGGHDRYDRPDTPKPARKPPKRKKRKSTARWILGEAVDLIEDIFD